MAEMNNNSKNKTKTTAKNLDDLQPECIDSLLAPQVQAYPYMFAGRHLELYVPSGSLGGGPWAGDESRALCGLACGR